MASWGTGPRVPKDQLPLNHTPDTCILVSLVVQFGEFGVSAKVGTRNELGCANWLQTDDVELDSG